MSPQTAIAAVRVCLLDEHRLMCEALAELLRREPEIEVVAACHSSTEALEVCGSREVDVLLLDLRVQGQNDFRFLDELHRSEFGGRTIILAAELDDHDIRQLVHLGVSGMILKDASPGLFVRCIREVAAGQVWFDVHQMRRILGSVAPSNGGTSAALFSSREREVVRMLLEGASNKEIADRLKMGLSMVKFVFRSLFRKMGVRTRAQLVRVVLERHRKELN